MSNQKSRYWAFVVYPESAPGDWREILQRTGLQFAVSPLHDKDLDPTDEEKKSHWHVIAVWDGPTTYATAQRIRQNVNGALAIPLNSVKGYYRYFTHKDNPEKHQYSESDITVLNGFNIADYVTLTAHEVSQIIKRLTERIRAEEVIEYSDFMFALIDDGTPEEFDVASRNTLYFNGVIRSLRSKVTGYNVDPKTGEVIE